MTAWLYGKRLSHHDCYPTHTSSKRQRVWIGNQELDGTGCLPTLLATWWDTAEMEVEAALAWSRHLWVHSSDHKGPLGWSAGCFLAAVLRPHLTPTGWRGNCFTPTPCRRTRNPILSVEVSVFFPNYLLFFLHAPTAYYDSGRNRCR